jgi:hypothetical protein
LHSRSEFDVYNLLTMSEKRKPKITILLKWEAKDGSVKRNKVEIYEASLFVGDKYKSQYRKLYRLRINGKWLGESKRFYYQTDIRNLLWKNIPFN